MPVRRRSSSARLRLASLTVTVALVAGGALAGAVPAGAATVKRPAVPQIPRAASHPFPLKSAGTAAAPVTGAVGVPRKASQWPGAATADVDPGVATAAVATSSAATPTRPATQATGTAAAAPIPLSLHARDATGAAAIGGAVHVQLWDRASTAAAGVSGVVFTVKPPVGASAAAVTASLDYSGFANAGSADAGSRLHLVELPACALTTPQVPACQVQTPIPAARNDAKSETLSADVALTAGPIPGAHAYSRIKDLPTVQAAPMVIAAVSGASGSTGDFSATSLAPSGTWSAGGASGAATWSYPIVTPPAASGSVAPKVALSYDSAEVDGRTATTNNQSSLLGEGWDYNPGYIERTYEPCSTFTDLPSASQTGDNCWAGQILTLSLNGSSNALVWDPNSQQVKLQSDDGSRVNHLTNASNGALNGEYWEVTTPDGTQYYFGRNGGPGQTTQPGTSSTWTEPVYGAHSGDPCYSSSGFTSSVCTQAWRWNLDYVQDVHGNATMYYYTPETNYYGQDNSTTGKPYIRGGWLNKIDYGLRAENGTVYGPNTPDQVLFTTAERCATTPVTNCTDANFTTTNSSWWPDVPVDQNCKSGDTCNVHSPTFWSRKMLSNITTQYWNGSTYTKVDSYDLGHQFPTDADPELWLSAITRTGYAADGTSITLPTITTHGSAMANRVAGYNSLPSMPHWRMTSLVLETGENLGFTYTTTCSTSTIPSAPSTNTSQCMPVFWAPMGGTPSLDYFNKYVLAKVTEANPTSENPPVSAQKVTQYFYVGAAAWHYDDDEVTKASQRTWGQWRGYGEVDLKTGDPTAGEPLTKSATFYYRGMNGDTLPAGKTRTATVTNTLNETTTDDYRYVDLPYETQVFNGDGGPELSATLTNYTVAATSATRARTGLPALTADMVRTAKARTLTDRAAGGVVTSTTTTTYDGAGRTVATDETGDAVPEMCTTTAYADNTAAWIRTRTSEVITSAQTPCPAVGTAQSNVQSDTRTYYDNSATLGQLTGAGDPTRSDVLNDTNGAAPAFYTASTTGYDPSGRVTSSIQTVTSTTTRMTATAYTPTDGGVLTKTVTTNPASQTATTVVDPGRGNTISNTDIAGHVTSATYDPLGRLTQVWKPGRVQGTNTPNQTYSYQLQSAGPGAVTTNTLVDYGTGTSYVSSVKLTDALGRTIQTQTAAEGGGSQVADTFYDGHGWTAATNNHYLISPAPSGTLQVVATAAVDDRTVDTFDGSGRVTLVTSSKQGTVTKSSRTVYGGDRTTVFPPTGGTIATTVVDARGRTTELDQYTSAPTVNGSVVSGGSYQPVTYHYDALGRQTQISADGATWTYTLDMLGNKLSSTDPDSGVTNTQYDLANEVVSAADARGQTLAYDYDNLGRKIGEYSGSVTGTKLASWTWDTLQAGHLSFETRYTTAGNYVTGTTSYDGMGNAMGQYVTLPFQETGLKGTWTTGYSYSSTGQILTMGPAPVAGVPAETVTNTYDALGIPTKVAGSSIVASQTLNGYALPGQITYGGSSNNAWENFTYDVQTLKPTDIALTAQLATAQVDDTKYTYDPAGNPTRISDTQGPAGSSPVDDQCFTYDALSRLSAAWTATDACAGAPNNAATGGNIGGPAPYWQSWTFNPDGTRNTQTIHALPGASGGDSTTTYGYGTVASSCAAGSANPAHGLDTTSSPGGGAAYCYDANGETTSRPDASGTGTQTLTWDAEGKLQKDVGAAGTTTWVNDADGNEVVRHDPGSTTLYLPGQEITRAANGTVTTIRSYSLGTIVVGESTGQAATTEYVYGDQHGTNQIAVNTTTLAVTRRALDPYGNPRGTVTGGTWPDHRGFLGKPTSTTTGLTDIGAREYDPVAGRFLSVDPLLETDDQRQMNGYCYGADNPVAGSDPTGKNWFSNTWDDFYSSVKDTVSTSISSSYHYFDNVGKDLSHCWGGNMWRCGQGAFNATPPGWLWNAGNGIWNSTNNFAGSCATGMYSTCAGNTLGLAASCAELLGCLGQPGGGFKGTKNIPGLSTDKWTNGPDTNPDLDTSKIEHALGGNLPPNFSVFDKWDPDTGTATSIKTIDWRYKSYAKPGAILSMGKGYVNDLVNFWAGTNTAQSQDKSIRITTDDVDTTVMNLAFPADGVTNDQLQAYQRIATYGYYKGITVNLIPVTTS